MTTAPTKEEIEALAAEYKQRAATAQRMKLTAAAKDCGRYADAEGEYETIAQALRLMAASIGAEPDYWAVQSMSGMHIGLWRSEDNARQAFAEYTGGQLIRLYATPPPSPDYAKGKRDGLEAAAQWHEARAAEYDSEPGPFQPENRSEAAGHRHHAARIRALNKDTSHD